MSYDDEIRSDTIVELNAAILTSIVDILKMHGPDPDNGAIICAGIVMAIKDVGRFYPSVPLTVSKMVIKHVESQR